MYSVYKLNKQGGNIQPGHTPFPIWNQSVVPRSFLTVASSSAYRFLKRQVRWSAIPIKNFPQVAVIHIAKGFGMANKAEIDVSLELCCFFNDPMDVGQLIFGSSGFSKSSLTIWKFTVQHTVEAWLGEF